MNPTAKTTGEGQPEEARTVREVVKGLYADGFGTPGIYDDLMDRLDLGEQKYGFALKEGWAEAKQEVYQELLDAFLYAVSAKDVGAMKLIMQGLLWLRDVRK